MRFDRVYLRWSAQAASGRPRWPARAIVSAMAMTIAGGDVAGPRRRMRSRHRWRYPVPLGTGGFAPSRRRSARAQRRHARQAGQGSPRSRGITEYRFAKRVALLFPDPSKSTITVNVTHLVGSRHEGYGESGMAHLLEHMVFKGTPRFPTSRQQPTAQARGPMVSTSHDRTNYFETFSATDDNLRWA